VADRLLDGRDVETENLDSARVGARPRTIASASTVRRASAASACALTSTQGSERRKSAGSGAIALALACRPPRGSEPPQLLVLFVTGGCDQPHGSRLLPNSSDERFIDAQLPRNEANAGSAALIELAAHLKHACSDVAPRIPAQSLLGQRP
jgi:hypothetical protein